MTVIEIASQLQQALNEAQWKLEVAIMSELYSYKKDETLDDVYHNLEVLRRITHKKIDKAFVEHHYNKETEAMFNAYSRAGFLFIDRSRDLARETHYFSSKGMELRRPRQEYLPDYFIPNP